MYPINVYVVTGPSPKVRMILSDTTYSYFMFWETWFGDLRVLPTIL
jgi:hypothetical protein